MVSDKASSVQQEFQQKLNEDFRKRVLPITVAGAFIFAFFFLFNISGSGNSIFVPLDFAALTMFAAIGWAIHKRKMKPVTGSAIILAMMLVFLVMIVFYSGATHAMLYYQGVIPFFAFFMMGSKAGRIHGAMMMSVVLFLWLGSELSWFAISNTSTEMGVFALLLLFSIVSAWVFESMREKMVYASFEQSKRYDALLQAIDEVYYRVGMDGVIEEIGDAVYTLTGYGVSEVEGQPITRFYTNPDDREGYVKALQKHGSVKNYPIGITGKYGQKIMILMSSRIVFDELGKPKHIEGMFRDITKERKTEKERKEHLDYLRALSMVEASLVEQNFEIAIQQTLGYMRELFGCDRVFLTPIHGLQPGNESLVSFADMDEFCSFEIDELVREGELITYLSSVPQTFGKSVFTVDSVEMFSAAVQEKYQIKSQMLAVLYSKPNMLWLLGMQQCHSGKKCPDREKSLFTDIAHRIQGALGQFVLQKNLQETVARVEIASKAKSEFLATMSHELRTPLHGVIGLLGELGMDKDSLSHEQRKNLELAQTSAQVLGSLIDDVLDLAKIESGNIELQKQSFVLQDALYGALVPFVMKAREKGLDLSLEMKCVPAIIEGDVVRLRQVLLNLVGNAMKFTEKGYVRVVVSEDDDMLQINIEDSGIGIDSQRHSEVFKPFTQVHDVQVLGNNLQEKGTGLGTTISQHFVEMMGGTLTLQSEPNIGSTLTIRIPLHYVGDERVTALLHMDDFTMLTTSMGSDKQTSIEVVKERVCSVLLAEDDPVGRRVATKRLERAGFQVVAVSDGFEAWELVKRQEFDLLLTDVRMPGLDGMELSKSIRKYEAEQERDPMYIIGLSAYALEEIKTDALACGMNEFVSKPVDMNALLMKLESCYQSSPLHK